MRTDKLLKEAIVVEYLSGNTTYRRLAVKHGVTYQNIQRWVKSYEGKKKLDQPPEEEPMPKEVKQLQAQLQKAKLENKLLNAMITIAEEQLGIGIRKKSGAKRS